MLKTVGSLNECLKTRAALITLAVMNKKEGSHYKLDDLMIYELKDYFTLEKFEVTIGRFKNSFKQKEKTKQNMRLKLA